MNRIRKQGEFEIPLYNLSGEKRSNRVTFRILPNINNGAPLRKEPLGVTR